MKTSLPPGSGPVISVACGALLSGVTIAATATGTWQLVGLGIAAMAVPVSLGGVHVLALRHDRVRTRRRRARAIVRGLLGEGKKLQHHGAFPHDGGCGSQLSMTVPVDPADSRYVFESTGDVLVVIEKSGPTNLPKHTRDFIEKVEDWRTTVGLRLRASPFVAGTDIFVLDPTGNRLDVPLNRLREILADLERWLDHGD